MLVLNALVTFALMVIICPTLVKKRKKWGRGERISDLKIHLNACAIEQSNHIMLIMSMHENRLMITGKEC